MSSPSVLWLVPDGAADGSPLAEVLGRDYRVVTLAASSAGARALAAVSPPVGAFVLVGQSTAAPAALALAQAAGEECVALILMAPVFETLPAADAAPELPTLLLLGTEDLRVPTTATDAISAALPRAHPILIYGAGHALDRDRVEAVASVIRDFIARSDQFIVRGASDLIYP